LLRLRLSICLGGLRLPEVLDELFSHGIKFSPLRHFAIGVIIISVNRGVFGLVGPHLGSGSVLRSGSLFQLTQNVLSYFDILLLPIDLAQLTLRTLSAIHILQLLGSYPWRQIPLLDRNASFNLIAPTEVLSHSLVHVLFIGQVHLVDKLGLTFVLLQVSVGVYAVSSDRDYVGGLGSVHQDLGVILSTAVDTCFLAMVQILVS